MKRFEIFLRKFIVRRHQFQLQRRIEKSSQRTVWRNRPVSRWVYWLVLKSIISQRLVGFTRQKKETKNPATCVLVICCLTRVINGKMIEDEVIYNFWRSSLEDFFLSVIKPLGTYFNTLGCEKTEKECQICYPITDKIKRKQKWKGNSLFQSDKQRLALSYTVVFFFYSQSETLRSSWLVVNTARWTTNCTFYDLSIFFTTDFKFLWQVGGASRI